MVYQDKIAGVQHKSLLPAYDVFDETRYFDSALEIDVIPFKGEMLGVSICEDMWNDPHLWPGRPYAFDPVEKLAARGATVLINLSASPFYSGKEEDRLRLIQNHAKKHSVPFVFVNQVGGNDELVFDGRSIVVDGKGAPVEIMSSFCEEVQTVDTTESGKKDLYVPQEEIAAVHDALVLGVKDYLRKCGFTKAIIGLSGGIDSAVTCAIAKEALGSENVLGVAMPSVYSAQESESYSRKLAENLDIDFKTVAISEIYDAYLGSLEKEFESRKNCSRPEAAPTEEEVGVELQNIQARIRGNILMAFSNKFGHLLLTTGNKSELAVGYCTLYGDMAGGLAVISDVPKTMVYELAEYLNRNSEVIPEEIITRVPSAELKPDQTDQDTLPPYDILDKILMNYLEDGYSAERLIGSGFDAQTVKWVIGAVNENEYKRRQAPPGLKVTTKAFGIGRRIPIAAKY